MPGSVAINEGQDIECINPKTNKMTAGTVTRHTWTFPWDDAPELEILCIYGIPSQLVRTVLMATDKDFEKPWAGLILIKEK